MRPVSPNRTRTFIIARVSAALPIGRLGGNNIIVISLHGHGSDKKQERRRGDEDDGHNAHGTAHGRDCYWKDSEESGYVVLDLDVIDPCLGKPDKLPAPLGYALLVSAFSCWSTRVCLQIRV